jgi:predicted transcriptional regulator
MNRMTSIKSVSVSKLMIRDIKTEKKDQNVITTCRIMYENNIGYVVILDKNGAN